jgi:nucleoside-diphosphate-sugar epimerase
VRPDGSGTARLVGSGDQHWTTIDADDLADLYVRAVDAAQPDAYYLGVSGQNPTVREIAEAAAHGGTVVAETVEESRARLGELFADALLLDQQSRGSAAVADLGWSPQRPSLLDTLR